MPRRNDIHRILIVGSGPIIIGQACEFDYSGAQACKALRADGYEVVLINSNPATIMTDPNLADRTYVEPLSVEYAEEVIRRERPDALLSTVGGQTGLNLSVALAEAGVLDKYGVELIGAKLDAIKKAEDRLLFKDAMQKIGLDLPQSQLVNDVEKGLEFAARIGYPVILRPSFTMGGSGGGIAYNREDLVEILERGLDLSPVHEVLIEESVLGWKEFELEVMRDLADNAIIVCSIENFDPDGRAHGRFDHGRAGADADRSRISDDARRARSGACARSAWTRADRTCSSPSIRQTGRMVIVEMNPRVSRSSALASKATGFPIAKIAAKLAVGYRLDEIKNDITRKTPACFEPTIDYVVVKIPRWQFEKFPGAEPVLGTQMKSVGEVMAIGRTFKQALGKGMRSLETGKADGAVTFHDDLIEPRLITPNPDRLGYIRFAFERGYTEEQVHALTSIDPWFLRQVREMVDLEQATWASVTLESVTREQLLAAKRDGISDTTLARTWKVGPLDVRARRKELGVTAVFNRVDTCAAEFESFTPYLYSSYESECEAEPTDRKKVMILGSGPNRIGQGIEFDYCCCHASFALQEFGVESIMVNCNPETVSTDYDTSDRLYFEPLTLEEVLNIYDTEKPDGVIVQFGGQTPLTLALPLKRAGVPIIGTDPKNIDLAEDRKLFGKLLDELKIPAPANGSATTRGRRVRRGAHDRLSGAGAAELRAGRARDGDRLRRRHRAPLHAGGGDLLAGPAGADRPVPGRRDRSGRGRAGGYQRRGADRRHHGAHRRSGRAFGRFSLRAAGDVAVRAETLDDDPDLHRAAGAGAERDRPDERAVRGEGRQGLRAGSESAGLAHGAVRQQGDGRAAAEDRRGPDAGQEDFAISRTPQGVLPVPQFFVKSPVFPFNKFPGVDPSLGPEMRSTGEVMGVGENFGEAFAKAQLSAGTPLPDKGRVFLSVNDRDKLVAVALAKRFDRARLRNHGHARHGERDSRGGGRGRRPSSR